MPRRDLNKNKTIRQPQPSRGDSMPQNKQNTSG